MPDPDVTRILQNIDLGDHRSADRLLAIIYDELRSLAEARLVHERRGHSLQATALVHEVYLRLVGPHGERDRQWENHGHFFAAAAEAMRRILIEHARARGAIKRGGDARRLSLDASMLTVEQVPAEVLDLHESLLRFEAEDPQKAMLVKLRFFGGLTLKETAEVLGLAPTTADRHWAYAKAWIFKDLSRDE